MNLPRSADGSHSGPFPLVRKGYQRESVDRFARATEDRIAALQQRCDSLISENTQLDSALGDARFKTTQVDFSALGERAQEILRTAEEQARDVTRNAAQEAEQLIGHAHAEADQLTGRTTTELGEVRRSQLAELETLRAQGERRCRRTGPPGPGRVRAVAHVGPSAGRLGVRRSRCDRTRHRASRPAGSPGTHRGRRESGGRHPPTSGRAARPHPRRPPSGSGRSQRDDQGDARRGHRAAAGLG